MSSFSDFSEKKCKNFGYTFAVIFLLLGFYDYFAYLKFFLIYFSISVVCIMISLFKPHFLKFLGFYWEKFGILLGRFFSPIILGFVYILTIIPINIIIRLLRIDLINKEFNLKKSSYWIKNKSKKINFEDQF